MNLKAGFIKTIILKQMLKSSKVINKVLFLAKLRLITLINLRQLETIRNRQHLDLQLSRTKIIISMK